MLLKPFFCHLFQIGICLPDASARLVDMTDCLCIQALFYRWKQFIPKPIAAVFTLLVRRVLDPVLSLLPQPGLNLAPLRPEKRTDDAPRTGAMPESPVGPLPRNRLKEPFPRYHPHDGRWRYEPAESLPPTPAPSPHTGGTVPVVPPPRRNISGQAPLLPHRYGTHKRNFQPFTQHP